MSSMLEGIDVPADIQAQLDLGLPLFEGQVGQFYGLQKRRELKRAKPQSVATLTCDELLNRHFATLKAVRAKESQIPNGLKGDWVSIQKDVLELKRGNTFDYGLWKTRLANLIIPIRVEKDEYL